MGSLLLPDIDSFYYRRMKNLHRSSFDTENPDEVNNVKIVDDKIVQFNMYVIGRETDLYLVPEFVRRIHVSFRPTGKFVIKLMMRCKGLDVIQMPQSYCDNISISSKLILDKEEINVIRGDIWGHRKDITEYATVRIEKEELKFPFKS